MFLIGALLAASPVTAAVGVVVVLILLSHPQLPVPRIHALVALVSAGTSVYLRKRVRKTSGVIS
ncbi:hypothetical protein GCM10010398_15960 [Streptomyces fimbriatus]